MKRKIGIAMLLIAVLLFVCSCGANNAAETPETYTVTVDNTNFTVNIKNCTITDGQNVYVYHIEGNTVRIYYPDNSFYWWTKGTPSSYGGWSDDYSPGKYVDGDILFHVIDSEISEPQNSDSQSAKNPFVIFLFLGGGLWNVISPYSAWYASYGWRFKNAEPSDAALGAARFCGVLLLIFGIILMFA